MATRSKGYIVALVLLLILLGILVPPAITVGLFRKQIQAAISGALGRPVTIGNTSLRLLPQPGFDLENFVVGDDPAFSAEPMLRADEVIALLRFSSLWRGRLEIAKLSLKYPSLNLVRRNDGVWNVEALLQRASSIPSAPTAKPRPEARPRFPYIEADSGRINFKLGQEKKVFFLRDADFSLWLESENVWHTRLSARPVRVDANLGDTGVLKINGRFQRARELRDTPLQFSITWDKAQLGQLTQLVYGRDRGWRGALDVSTTLSGTPAALNLASEASIREFRRYDILLSDNYPLSARCTGHYSSTTGLLSAVNCQMPFGSGQVAIRGELSGPIQPRSYDLSLAAERVPMQAVVAFVRHAKKDIPEDLAVTGSMDALFSFRRPSQDEPALWTGGGSTTDLIFRSTVLRPDLHTGAIRFLLQGAGQQPPAPTRLARNRPLPPRAPISTSLVVAPFALPLGGSEPAVGTVYFTGSEYNLSVQGDSQLARVIQIGRMLAVPTFPAEATGNAELDLAIGGQWSGMAAPVAVGTADLRKVKTEVPGIAAPLTIDSAELILTRDSASLQRLSGNFGSGVSFTGKMRLPRECPSAERCPVSFDLHTGTLSLDQVNRLVNPAIAKHSWYYSLTHSSRPSILPRLQLQGRLAANHVILKSVTADRVSAGIDLHSGVLRLTAVQGDLFGGKYHGDWQLDFTGQQPAHSSSGTVTGISLGQLSTAMHDNWASGTVNASYNVSFSGFTAPKMLASASGDGDFDCRKGELRHLTLDSSSLPLRFARWQAKVALQAGALRFAPSKITTPNGIYELSGTTSLGRQLELTLRNRGHQYTVTGTLDKPRVQLAPALHAGVSSTP